MDQVQHQAVMVALVKHLISLAHGDGMQAGAVAVVTVVNEQVMDLQAADAVLVLQPTTIITYIPTKLMLLLQVAEHLTLLQAQGAAVVVEVTGLRTVVGLVDQALAAVVLLLLDILAHRDVRAEL
jgi:hypothetical protein